MELPWHDLLVSDIVSQMNPDLTACDSAVEIPWAQLSLEGPPQIRPPPLEGKCSGDDIEVPWDDIMVPRNIIIATKTRKHPSNTGKRQPISEKCQPCNRCPKEQKNTRKLPGELSHAGTRRFINKMHFTFFSFSHQVYRQKIMVYGFSQYKRFGRVWIFQVFGGLRIHAYDVL